MFWSSFDGTVNLRMRSANVSNQRPLETAGFFHAAASTKKITSSNNFIYHHHQ